MKILVFVILVTQGILLGVVLAKQSKLGRESDENAASSLKNVNWLHVLETRLDNFEDRGLEW